MQLLIQIHSSSKTSITGK